MYVPVQCHYNQEGYKKAGNRSRIKLNPFVYVILHILLRHIVLAVQLYDRKLWNVMLFKKIH